MERRSISQSEELLAEEKGGRESNGKQKKKKKKKKEKKETELATTREESIAPSIEPVAAAVCSLEDAGGVTGRELAMAESSKGGESTCIVCFEGDKTHAAVPCGHQTVCGPCSEKIVSCPICRAKAQPWIHVRLA